MDTETIDHEPTTNGINEPNLKRRRTIEDVDDFSVHTPQHHARISAIKSTTPREMTPDPFEPTNPRKAITFYDDHDDEAFEWIRIPKIREYDLFRVARHAPEDRNKAAMPLVAVRDDGQHVTMWAKMDTGADANLINQSTLAALLGLEYRRNLAPNTMNEAKEYVSMGNNKVATFHHVKLSFTAGLSSRKFENVRFEVVADDWENPNGDGIPNVVLGLGFIEDHNMMMIDLEYHCDADPKLPVIAQRAEDEAPGSARILITKHPQTKGFVRPVKGR